MPKKIGKKPNLNTKSGKLWLGLQKGMRPKDAAKEAGVSPANVTNLTRTDNFQALERSSYKEEILKHITMAQIAQEHVKVLTQDGDLGAKNTAIKLAIEKLEPGNAPAQEQEKIVVILK